MFEVIGKMQTKIFYFSGTGNTLALARAISVKTGAALISIPKVEKDEKIHMDVKNIGIVFPSYIDPLAGLPRSPIII
jgi:flavodoxin